MDSSETIRTTLVPFLKSTVFCKLKSMKSSPTAVSPSPLCCKRNCELLDWFSKIKKPKNFHCYCCSMEVAFCYRGENTDIDSEHRKRQGFFGAFRCLTPSSSEFCTPEKKTALSCRHRSIVAADVFNVLNHFLGKTETLE